MIKLSALHGKAACWQLGWVVAVEALLPDTWPVQRTNACRQRRSFGLSNACVEKSCSIWHSGSGVWPLVFLNVAVVYL
jgi:hypothetical protein